MARGRKPPTYDRSGKGRRKRGIPGKGHPATPSGRKTPSPKRGRITSPGDEITVTVRGTKGTIPGNRSSRRPGRKSSNGFPGELATPGRAYRRRSNVRFSMKGGWNTSEAFDGDYPGGDRPRIRIVGSGNDDNKGNGKVISIADVLEANFNNSEKKHKKTLTAKVSLTKPGVTYQFKKKDIQRLFKESPEFAAIAKSGKYFYYNGYIILFHPECVKIGDKVNTITISRQVYRAPSHFCLSVVTKKDGSFKIVHAKQYNVLSGYRFDSDIYMDPECGGYLYKIYCSAKKESSGKSSGTAGSSKDGKGSDQSGDDGSGLPPSVILRMIIFAHLDDMHLSLNAFAKQIQMKPDNIMRIYTRPNSVPKLDTVLAVCLGLHMQPPISEIFIKLAGQSLNRSKYEEEYRYLLNFRYKDSIEACNRYLLDHHINALTAKTK